jgi:flagella basal body P-ring formation protein FlgA
MKNLLLLLIFFTFSYSQELVLKDKYTLNHETIYSDDLFKGLELSFEIKKIPNDMFVYKIPADDIVKKFKSYNIDVKKPTSYYVVFEKEMIYDKNYIKNYISDKYKAHIPNLIIKDIKLKSTMRTSLHGFEIESISLDKFAMNVNRGTASVKFRNGSNFRTLYINYNIIGTIKVVQSIAHISKEEPISNANISTIEMPFEKKIDSIKIEDLDTNICAKNTIARNTIIKTSFFKKIPLIKKGSVVTAIYKMGALSIEFEVVAMQDGAKRELISVKRVDNDKIYKASVITHSLVRVH